MWISYGKEYAPELSAVAINILAIKAIILETRTDRLHNVSAWGGKKKKEVKLLTHHIY